METKTLDRSAKSRTENDAEPTAFGVIVISRHASEAQFAEDLAACVQQSLGSGFALQSAWALPPGAAQIEKTISTVLNRVDFLIVCGGTGLSADDTTPQILNRICDYEIPGFGELLRAEGRKITGSALLSRGGAWISGRKLILALSGSSKAAAEQLEIVREVLPKALCGLKGRCDGRR